MSSYDRHAPRTAPANVWSGRFLGGRPGWILPVATAGIFMVSGANRSALHACVRGRNLSSGLVVWWVLRRPLDQSRAMNEAKLAGVPVAAERCVVSTTNSKKDWLKIIARLLEA